MRPKITGTLSLTGLVPIADPVVNFELDRITDLRFLEGLADPHAPCPSVLASSEVGPQVDTICLTELKSQSTPAGGQEVVDPERLITARDHLTDAPKPDNSESFGQ